jgi:Flp pilus assembly pilin Flp
MDKLTLYRLWNDESGQDMIEYSLLCAALVIVVAGFFPPAIAQNMNAIFSKVSSQLNGAGS